VLGCRLSLPGDAGLPRHSIRSFARGRAEALSCAVVRIGPAAGVEAASRAARLVPGAVEKPCNGPCTLAAPLVGARA
jgi:hypothetical protein